MKISLDIAKANEEVVPIFARSHFFVSLEGQITQILTFHYYDGERYYAHLQASPEDLQEDLEKITINMSQFLAEEKNILNGERVHPQIIHTELFFQGEPFLPTILMFIEFGGPILKGKNLYESWTDEEQLEYDCIATWTFPEKTTVLKIVSKLQYIIHPYALIFKAKKGDWIGGHEKIYFQIP